MTRRVDQGDVALVERILRTQNRWMAAKEIAELLGYTVSRVSGVLRRLERDRRAFNDAGLWAGPEARAMLSSMSLALPAIDPTTMKWRVIDALVRVRVDPALYGSRDGWVSAYRVAVLLGNEGEVNNKDLYTIRRTLDSLLTNREGRFVLSRPPPIDGKHLVPTFRATDAAVAMMRQASAAK